MHTLFKPILKIPSSLKPESWSVLLTIGLSLLVYKDFFARLQHQSLTNFTSRSIGITVLAGVDAAARTMVYVQTLIFFTLVFAVIYVGLGLVNNWAVSQINPLYIRIEKTVLSVLSAFFVGYLLLYWATTQPQLGWIILVLLAFIGLILGLIGYKICLSHWQPRC